MTRSQYEQFGLDIARGKCITHEGRSASSQAELDWIFEAVYGSGKGKPVAAEKPEQKPAPTPKAPAKPKAPADPNKPKPKRVRNRSKLKPVAVADDASPVFAEVKGERINLRELSESALLELADAFGIPGADSMSATELMGAVKAMADKAQ